MILDSSVFHLNGGGGTSLSGLPWFELNSDTTLEVNTGYYIDLTSNDIFATLPTAINGDHILFWVFGNNNLYITSTEKIEGGLLNADFYRVFSTDDRVIRLVFSNTQGWEWDSSYDSFFTTEYLGTGNTYFRIEYDKTLTEIQLTFAGGVDPVQLNVDAGVVASSSDITSHTILLNGFLGTAEDGFGVGKSTTAGVFGYVDLQFNEPKLVKYLWATPRGDTTTGGGGIIYAPPTRIKISGSPNGVSYTLLADFPVSNDILNTYGSSGFTGTLLRPRVLTKFVIYEE